MINNAVKPKPKPMELGANENRGVRFMRNTRPAQKNPISRSTVTPQSLLPQKNVVQKNENWRGSNNVNSTTKGNGATGSMLSQSMHPTVRTFNAVPNATSQLGPRRFVNASEEESKNGGKIVSHGINSKNSMYDAPNKGGIQKNILPNNANESNQFDKRAARKTCYDNFPQKRGDNTNVNNLRPLQHSTMATTSHISQNVKGSNNMNTNNMNNNNNNNYNNNNNDVHNSNNSNDINTNNMNNLNKANKGPVVTNAEEASNKDSAVKNAENFLNTYCSPIKRKLDTSVNCSSIKTGGGITYEDLITPNKRFAPRSPNVDAGIMEHSKNGNERNEKYFGGMSNKNGNNFMNSFAGIGDSKGFSNNRAINSVNENTSSYIKFANGNMAGGSNSNAAVDGSGNFSEKKMMELRSKNDSLLNSSSLIYGTNPIKTNEDIPTNSTGRNYPNYGRMKNNGNVDLLNVHNTEIANKTNFADKSRNRNISEYKDPIKSINADSTVFPSGIPLVTKTGRRNVNYLADNNSEKMISNNFRTPNSNNTSSAIVVDRSNEENGKVSVNKKVDLSGNDSLFNNIHSNIDTESNFIKNSMNKSTNKMNSNNSKTKNLMGTDMSNEKISLMNSLLDNSNANMDNTPLKPMRTSPPLFSENSLINSNKEAIQESGARLQQKEGVNDTTSNKVDIEELQQLVRNRKKNSFATYEYNDKDIAYLQNAIMNLPKCNCSDQDVDMLYKTVMNLNEYALNFQYENERIEKFHNLTNAIKSKDKEATDFVENNLKKLENILQEQNKEYSKLCLKLQESESMFSDINDETGEKKLKVCSEIDEKKNALRREYLKKKMTLDKNKYKLEKMKEDNLLERKSSIYNGNRFKRRYKLMESIFRIKVLKYDGNVIDFLLMPPNVQKHMWQRIQIEKNAINIAFRNYLWSYVESFSEVKRWREYFKDN